MATPEENKRVVLRQIEALNAGDVAELERLVHPHFFDHEAGGRRSSGGPPGDPVGALQGRFSGSHLEPLDILAEEDRVAVRARVTRDGVASPQIHIWRLLDGLIVEHWPPEQAPTPTNSNRREERR